MSPLTVRSNLKGFCTLWYGLSMNETLTIFNLRGTAAFRRQGDRSGLTRAQRPSEAQSNKLCDPSMGEQNLLSKAASFRGQWLTSIRRCPLATLPPGRCTAPRLYPLLNFG